MVTISEDHFNLFEKYVSNVFPEHKSYCTISKLYTAEVDKLIAYETFFRAVNFSLIADHADDLKINFEDITDVKSSIKLFVILSNVCTQLHHVAITQLYQRLSLEE